MSIRYSSIVTLAFLAASATASATEYAVDKGHSNVGFTVKHLVSKVSGDFGDFEGAFSFDEKKPQDSKVTFTVKTASINTREEKRDNHLRSPDFFDAEKNPELKFVSKKLTPAGKGKYKLEGDLTMRGVTKPVTFDVEYLGEATDPWGGTRAGFTAKTKVNRKDYGISWNKTLDKGGLLVGEEVELNLQVEATKKQPEAKKM